MRKSRTHVIQAHQYSLATQPHLHDLGSREYLVRLLRHRLDVSGQLGGEEVKQRGRAAGQVDPVSDELRAATLGRLG